MARRRRKGARRSYRRKRKGGRRRGSKKIPLLLTLGTLGTAMELYANTGAPSYGGQTIKSMVASKTLTKTGALWAGDVASHPDVLIKAGTPLIVGIIGSAVAGKLGLNKYMARVPLVGKKLKF